MFETVAGLSEAGVVQSGVGRICVVWSSQWRSQRRHPPELVTRITELTAQAHDAAVTVEQLRRDKVALSSRLEQADEDVLAARARLRRMIRGDNAGDQSGRP